VSVTDGDGKQSSDSVSVHNDLPQSVVLQPLVAQAAGLLLTWTPPVEPDFAEYHVYRATSAGGPFSLIDILTNPSTSQYRDVTATLGVVYYYRIGLMTTTGAESQSNVQSGAAGVFIAMGTSGVDNMIVDPTRPFIYAIDRVNNTLVFIHRDSLKITKKIFIGSGPTDLDIDKAGTELFVANYGSSEIAVVNLDTQTKTRSLIVDTGGIWDGNPYSITCLTQGRLAWTSYDQWNSIRLIETQNGTRFGSDFGSYYYPDLVSTPDGTHVFVVNRGRLEARPIASTSRTTRCSRPISPRVTGTVTPPGWGCSRAMETISSMPIRSSTRTIWPPS
jgi:DNA-binding beta-propeller fold protein YncE